MKQLQKFLSKANFKMYPNVYAVIDNNDLVKAFYSLNEAIDFRRDYFSKQDIFFTFENNKDYWNDKILSINESNMINYF
jgi:hypothetical protein